MRAGGPIAGASVLAAAWLCFDAYRAAVADEIVAVANTTLESPAWRKSPPSLPQWLAVRNELLRAEGLAPDSAAVRESLGVLHARRAASPEMLAYARDYFAAALERRPNSPYTWANYAETRYLLGELGRGFEHALVRAVETGPWEVEVQRVVSDAGLAVFDDLQPATREAVRRMVGFGMRRQPQEILQIAERRGRLGVACREAEHNMKKLAILTSACAGSGGARAR